MPWRLVCISIVLLLVACDRGERPNGTGNSMQQLKVGQVWTYNTRPGEEASRIVICRVEPDPQIGQIVHIHVKGVRLNSKQAPERLSEQIGHMPYSEEALRKSLKELESTDTALPDFEDGYQQWRSAFDKRKAGVWTAPVSEAISGIESALNQ